MQKSISEFNLEKINSYSNIIFLCIGTDQISGDAFGPIVGQKLKYYTKNMKNIEVIGGLGKCVVYQNLEKIEEEIYTKYKNPYIVCVDSALSKSIDVGQIVVEKGKIKIGSVLGKKIKQVGDMSIKGVVAKNKENYKENYKTLEDVPIDLVISMANVVVDKIKNVYL